jgi:hypothetical protein
LEDKIALIYDLTDIFSENGLGIHVENMVVDNNYSVNNHRNPHKSFGYLRTPEIAAYLAGFLRSEKSNFLHRLYALMRDNLRPVFYRNR